VLDVGDIDGAYAAWRPTNRWVTYALLVQYSRCTVAGADWLHRV
jgi:hypothetical protein